ncbi:DTW domain-containing protein [Paraglaciecola aquimarina]|uniref:tRNA-uridine aminocarboxypropyltransferase n=1 Tax=Paraglaciecola algarum TaxID=3050085 RepID=A0ABS9DAZ2_9ALTE|nr:tRNA-uridine aminocarboxypropyltransferase [Paraglaciecola sp. G1-23]MCF2948969.1 DTW domain-containing protein [Paraglaciecola sp. G1-23]
MTTYNSVLRLRSKQLLQSTRAFKARGFKVKRCEFCLIPQTECICSQRPKISSQCAFCLLMYKDEYYKPSNTGRIIADVIPDNHAFLWHRVTPEPAFLNLLQHPDYAPIVVFPHEYAQPEKCIDSPLDLPAVQKGKTPLFIMLDGTWREAKKMFKSPSLAKLPVLGIQPQSTSNYRLREAAQDHQLCTAEVAIEILRLANDHLAANALAKYFEVFREAYIVGKPHLK